MASFPGEPNTVLHNEIQRGVWRAAPTQLRTLWEMQNLSGGMAHPALKQLRQEDCQEFKTTLGHKIGFMPIREGYPSIK